MEKLKLVLVVPNYRWAGGEEHTFWHFIPYNLCCLAAMVEDVCEIEIIDAYAADMKVSELTIALRKSNPDVIGITILMDQFAPAGHLCAKLVKLWRSDRIVIMGGVYATVNWETAIQDENVDYVVIGEGEYVLRELIGTFLEKNSLPNTGICYRSDGQVINRGRAAFIQDLNALPLPAYHLVPFEKYSHSALRKSVDSPRLLPYARIITSRGCPYHCVFCQVESIAGSHFRPRSAKHVLKEIAWLKDTYHIRSIIFDDDNLFTDRKRAVEIFSGMIEQGLAMPWVSISTAVFRLDEALIEVMCKSGCQHINIAIESGSERVLQEIVHKPVNYEHARQMVSSARKRGIYVAANFIIGFPTETWDEIRGTIRFAEELNVDYVKIFHAIPLRNTRLWDLCVKEGVFKEDFDHSNLRWNTGQIETKDFSARDLTILRAYEWDRINFSTPEKRQRTAQVIGITEEELLQIRRKTLQNAIKNISGTTN